MLKTTHLNIGYKQKTVQQDLNLQADRGEVVCLMGANGCGKSTLLRTLCGLQKPLSGAVLIDGTDLAKVSESQKALFFAFVLTDRVEVDNLRVFDMVFMGRYPHTSWLGNRTKEDIEKTQIAIRMVRLEEKQNSFVSELSDGERQRAMIAKALAQDTPVIILDEPTAHLDIPNRQKTMRLLKTLAIETGKSIIISTHELDLALQNADKIWLMGEDGICEGSPADSGLLNKIEVSFSIR